MKNFIKTMLFAFFAMVISATTYAEPSPPNIENEDAFIAQNEMPGEPGKVLLVVDTNLNTYHPENPPIVQHASMNPVDYGLVGTMALGIMGLLTYMIRSDRADRQKLTDAIDNLRNSVEAQRQSNDRLSAEIHSLVKGLESRMDNMEDSVRRIEDQIRRS